jgi:hypothetical protein
MSNTTILRSRRLAHLQRLVELLVVLDEQHAARVLAQVVHLAGRVGG